ncbi:MAG: aconitate hydratase AcnA [Sphaerobacter sp.]|nr:aconitate hydratase AcnA [Sphaerobacter sp.]
MAAMSDPFGARSTLSTPHQTVTYYRLAAIADQVTVGLDRLPYTVKVLLENVLRHAGAEPFSEEDVATLAQWQPGERTPREFPFLPGRVLLQDFTGVPAVVDLAAMRSAVVRLGGDPSRINPLVPVDLVIDHSVQVDVFGSRLAFRRNVEREYERNRERYALLRWAQQAFQNFRVVPPGTGIVHQVNLEYLAQVVSTRQIDGETVAFPDTLVGTDSHTPMVNGLGVLGWGVGGIEAEAVLLGQPIYLLTPEVVGFRLVGEPPEGVTATDLVLTVTQLLRQTGVVGRFVEFFGPSLRHLSLPDRATISNMAPEYGATATMFPIDDETLNYLRFTGRSEELVELVERYAKEQGLFQTDQSPEPLFDQIVELDLSTLEPSVAGPRRPQDRVPLAQVSKSLRDAFKDRIDPAGASTGGTAASQPLEAVAQATAATATVAPPSTSVPVRIGDQVVELTHGSVVIAAITSCTNTSNPEVMIAAGLLAKKAVERGLDVNPAVKTSLAPGSGVVTAYLDRAGLTPYLEALRFHLVGYGCTTCIGNSGPLPEPVAKAVQEHDLVVAAVLSGNRNFEGRIHPLARASYLASPPLVVAYALAGTLNIDLTTEPIGYDPNGEPVYLREIWPSTEEIRETMARAVTPELFRERYADVFRGDEHWQALPLPEQSELFAWDPNSTYVREPSFFQELSLEPRPLSDIRGGRVLVYLGDSVTTDHISPAGSIAIDSPAGRYLIEHGVEPRSFNSYGSRRGNHEVMVRGTFANIRLRNKLAGGREGNWTTHLPSGELMTIYDAAMRYQEAGTPLVVLAGAEYGSGSSRDWAAKGPLLLGVRAVIAQSYERIHRSNLIGMGILPLQFEQGQSAESLGLTGHEVFDIQGIAEGLSPRKRLTVRATREDGSTVDFPVIVRIDSPTEVEYYRHGGILPMVLRRLVQQA